jgi:hypothetical protein
MCTQLVWQCLFKEWDLVPGLIGNIDMNSWVLGTMGVSRFWIGLDLFYFCSKLNWLVWYFFPKQLQHTAYVISSCKSTYNMVPGTEPSCLDLDHNTKAMHTNKSRFPVPIWCNLDTSVTQSDDEWTVQGFRAKMLTHTYTQFPAHQKIALVKSLEVWRYELVIECSPFPSQA